MFSSDDAASTTGVRCHRCAFASDPRQTSLFGADDFYVEEAHAWDGAVLIEERQASGWPGIETSHCGRFGFWRERSPAVFGRRVGVGPLVVMPDTNILIALREELEEAEGGLIIHPLWGAHGSTTEALRELVQLWWWRDLRFAVSPLHLVDAPEPLTGERRQAREDAVRELGQDYLERGGNRAVIAEELQAADQPCPLHAVPASGRRADSEAARQWLWPKDKRDRGLVEAAYDDGCHVFLTADKGVLKCHDSLFRSGLAILTPGELLTALDEAGELDETRSGNFPIPDLSTITHLYAGFSSD